MTEENKKRVARALKNMLDVDGVNLTVKEVLEKIEDEEDLSSLDTLKEKLANDMRANPPEPKMDRMRVISDFLETNWDLIRDNDVVKKALFNSYCMGRRTKARRDEMVRELLNKLEGVSEVEDVGEVDENTNTSEVVENESTNNEETLNEYTF